MQSVEPFASQLHWDLLITDLIHCFLLDLVSKDQSRKWVK